MLYLPTPSPKFKIQWHLPLSSYLGVLAHSDRYACWCRHSWLWIAHQFNGNAFPRCSHPWSMLPSCDILVKSFMDYIYLGEKPFTKEWTIQQARVFATLSQAFLNLKHFIPTICGARTTDPSSKFAWPVSHQWCWGWRWAPCKCRMVTLGITPYNELLKCICHLAISSVSPGAIKTWLPHT